MKGQRFIEELRLLAESGMPFYKIAAKLRCDPRTVKSYVEKCGLLIERVREPLTDAESATVRQLFAEGFSINHISRRLGRSWNAIDCVVRGLTAVPNAGRGRGLQVGWPIVNTDEWRALDGRRYEDVPATLLEREWSGAPVNGQQLARAAMGGDMGCAAAMCVALGD